MKLKSFFVFLAAIGLIHNISFAQDKENSNPYAIFGSNPYIAGDKVDGEHVKILVIENIRDNSQIARLEHNTETGVVTAFDNENMVVLQKKLKEGERAWPTQDRFAEKYYHLSPYSFTGGNPVNYIDLNGDSITIVHRTGFLGLGGKETLTYENGSLYNADGSAYTGKVRGYLKSVMGALGSLNATSEGALLVSELQNSTNMFTIMSGSSNRFAANSMSRAGANLSEVQAITGNTAGSTGSGGTIYWNASSTRGGLDLTGSTSRPAYIGLGHEMGHASDANLGLLHYSRDFTNAAGSTYFSTYNGLLKSEWRAVYRENLIRGQAGISLRTHYGIDMTTGTPIGTGPSLVTPIRLPFAPQPIYIPLNYR